MEKTAIEKTCIIIDDPKRFNRALATCILSAIVCVTGFSCIVVWFIGSGARPSTTAHFIFLLSICQTLIASATSAQYVMQTLQIGKYKKQNNEQGAN